jgi:hypothetical protein
MAYDALPNPTGIEWGSADRTYGRVKFGDDSAQVVLFYTRSVFNAAKSRAAGARHYDNETWVKMHPPGEKLNIIDRPATDLDKSKYPGQWNMFLQNKTQVPEGTPIDLLFPNNPAVADNLRAYGIHTIQQCATLSSHAVQTIGMGAQEWQNMAKQYLDSASNGSAFLAMRTELDKKDVELRVMKQQYDKLQAQLMDIQKRFNNPSLGPTAANWGEAPEQVINNNHPSQEMRPSKRGFPAPSKDELEQFEVAKQITEQDFPTIDVTKGDKNG